MKLSNLKETPEILNIDQSLGISQNIIDGLTPMKRSIDGFPVYSVQFTNNGVQHVLFALKNKKDEFMSFLVMAVRNDIKISNNKQSLQIKRVFVKSEFRNKGLAKAMYFGITEIGFILVSDQEQTNKTFNLWSKISRDFPSRVKKYNIKERRFTDEEPKGDKNIVFILESDYRDNLYETFSPMHRKRYVKELSYHDNYLQI